MATTRTRRKKRAATNQPQERQAKQRKQLSTEIRPLRSNAALRARLRSEEEAVARPLMLENQKQSPFLQLPGEIRMRIYQFALGGNVIQPGFIRKTDVTPGRVARYRTNRTARRTFRSMILSCRAINAETELLLYNENVFSNIRMDADDWLQWFQLLNEKKRAAIRMVNITFRRNWLEHDPKLKYFDMFPSLKLMIVQRRVCLSEDSVAATMKTYAPSRKWQLITEKTRCRWHEQM